MIFFNKNKSSKEILKYKDSSEVFIEYYHSIFQSEIKFNEDTKEIDKGLGESYEKALNIVSEFILQDFGNKQSKLLQSESSLLWEQVAEFNLLAKSKNNFRKYIEPRDFLESITYLSSNAKNGTLFMQDNKSYFETLGYRVYLTSNSVSEKLNWDWQNWEQSLDKTADKVFIKLMAKISTEVYDYYGLTSKFGFVLNVVSMLLNDWHISDERLSLAANETTPR